MEPEEIIDQINEIVETWRHKMEEGYRSRELAERIVTDLRNKNPRLLREWLNLRAADLLWRDINAQDGRRRSYNRRISTRDAFHDAARMAEGGDSSKLTTWLETRWTIEDGTRIALANLRRADLEYVAGECGIRSQQAKMQEAFMRALADRVGDRVVGDVFTEEEIAKLWMSLSS